MRRATVAVLLAAVAGAAQAQASEPADPLQAAAAELIDPDCYPVWAQQADPALLEEPDGICPPGSPKPPEGGGAKPGSETGPGAEPAPAEQTAPPPGSSPPQAMPDGTSPAATDDSPAAPPKSSKPKPGRRSPDPEAKRRRPANERDPVQRDGTERRPANERDRFGRRRQAERDRRLAQRQQQLAHRRRLARRRAAAERLARRVRRERGLGETVAPVPQPRFPAGALRDTLPDPIPPARRLDRRFAERLARVSDRTRVPWELMLAVLRARGNVDTTPAGPRQLRRLARRLARLGARKHPRRAIRRIDERRSFVQRVVALAHYNHAVRRAGLVRGLNAVRKRLARRVLEHDRLDIYAGGRADINSGFTDVRVLVLLLYLASRSDEVSVTSLTSGHSFLTASGNVSLHSHGRAVDIAAIGGRPILGNQQPGGLTERTLHNILLLPKRLQPSELISLFQLGGPSFALADHADHIHAGY
jgi:hypothetical protein